MIFLDQTFLEPASSAALSNAGRPMFVHLDHRAGIGARASRMVEQGPFACFAPHHDNQVTPCPIINSS
jgi:hypothetical protein